MFSAGVDEISPNELDCDCRPHTLQKIDILAREIILNLAFTHNISHLLYEDYTINQHISEHFYKKKGL